MEPGPFAWWDSHDRAWRSARMLFFVAAEVVAVYVIGLVATLAAVLSESGVGPWDGIDEWVDDVGAAGLVATSFVVVVVAVAAIVVFGWRGVPRTTRRLSRAREPEPHELDRLRTAVGTPALAYGMQAPKIWMIDDDGPNALAFGRPAAGNVCVTTGALHLPKDELDALCMFHVTALASRVFTYATAAADLVLLGEWCTRLLWATAAGAFFTLLLGVPFEVAGSYLLGVALLVCVTRPMLFFTDRGLVKLIDGADELIDLEMVNHSARPESLALLILDLVENDQLVVSRWEIAHLWFEREIVDFDTQPYGFLGRGRYAWTGFRYALFSGYGAPPFSARCVTTSRRSLLERAGTAINLANGDAQLRSRLARAVANR